MMDFLQKVNSPLFAGMEPQEREAILGCIGYHTGSYRKGEIIACGEENLSTGWNLRSICVWTGVL